MTAETPLTLWALDRNRLCTGRGDIQSAKVEGAETPRVLIHRLYCPLRYTTTNALLIRAEKNGSKPRWAMNKLARVKTGAAPRPTARRDSLTVATAICWAHSGPNQYVSLTKHWNDGGDLSCVRLRRLLVRCGVAECRDVIWHSVMRKAIVCRI